MTTGHYNNFSEVAELLKLHNINYVIMRNYSNLLSEELYISGHPDIDILCENSAELAETINAKQYKKDDITHYYIFIKNKVVSLDLRYVGDGYYPTNWQLNILQSKELHHDGFYVMNKLNYLYSLTYHAVIQKRAISKEYIDFLLKLSDEIGVKVDTSNQIKSLIENLEEYMINNNYNYTYTKDKTVVLNRKYISSHLIEKNIFLQIRHFRFDTKVWIIEQLVKIKHLLNI